MIDMKTAMLSALQHLPACTEESFLLQENPLPLIVVGDAERSVLARADGKPYLEHYRAQALQALNSGKAELSRVFFSPSAASL